MLDIGSNSVRLVVYERLCRSLTPLYNEKALCGLGKGVGQTGALNDTSVALALRAVGRYAALARQMSVQDLYVVATAAVREASNGDAFIEAVEALTDAPVQVLAGADEARFAGEGVLAGFAEPDGIAGDLGGGSLELIDVANNELGQGKTFPLGGIRLFEDSAGDLTQAQEIAEQALGAGTPLDGGKGRKFYAIGGTWRALAKAHMAKVNYPLRVTHHYALGPYEALALCEQLIQGVEDAPQPLDFEDSVSKNRRKLLPFGAVVLQSIIRRMEPSKVIFSTLGMREGYLFDRLDPQERARDPLIEAAREFAILRARSPEHAQELVEFTDHFYDVAGIEEKQADRRARHAACYVEDVGWRAHPDYRGLQSVNLISNAALVGIDHSHRVMISLISFFQHEGLTSDDFAPEIVGLLSERKVQAAKTIAAVMRLAYLFSASMPDVLPQLAFQRGSSGKIELVVPAALQPLVGDKVNSRLRQLSQYCEFDCQLAH